MSSAWADRLGGGLGIMVGADSATGSAARPQRRYDVALSYAGAQREYVEQVAAALKGQGVSCFYDNDEQVSLWGKRLVEELGS